MSTTAVRTYTATATREGRWWVLEVEGVGATQSRTLDGATVEVADMIATMLDLDPADVEVDVVPVGEDIDEAREARQRIAVAESELREASGDLRAAVLRLLTQDALTQRDVARVLGVSRQRVAQLAKS